MNDPAAPQSTTSTADRVQSVALALFARQGYEATTLAQIADGVGIRKPSLYNHIESKAQLFLDLVAQVEAAFFVIQDASLARHADASAEQRLRALVEDLSAFIFTESQGAFYKRCLLFPPEPLAAQIREINEANERRIDRALRDLYLQGQREDCWHGISERAFLDAFYCLMDGLYSQRFIYDETEYQRRLASSWAVFWAGLVHARDA